MSRWAGYTDNGSSSITVVGLTPPTIVGLTTLTLNAGYGTGEYTLTGTEPVVVEKTAGDASITWNNVTKKLDIAAGSYPVTLKASNGASPDATLVFTLTVAESGSPGGTG